MVNAILAKRVNHIVTKGDNPAWPKGSKSRGFSNNFQIKPGLNGRRLFTRSFRLLYLWYDVLGKDGVEHRKEIEQFAEIAQRDNIKFSHITYQEVIMKLSKEFYEGNEDYLNYITDRYL